MKSWGRWDYEKMRKLRVLENRDVSGNKLRTVHEPGSRTVERESYKLHTLAGCRELSQAMPKAGMVWGEWETIDVRNSSL